MNGGPQKEGNQESKEIVWTFERRGLGRGGGGRTKKRACIKGPQGEERGKDQL